MSVELTRRHLISFVLLISGALFLSACSSNDTADSANAPVISAPPKTALPMPPLNGRSLENMGWNLADGKHTAFSEFKGKVLILDFYATWCAPCRDSVPHLVDLQRRYENDIQVIGLNVGGPDDADRVPDFARELKIQYPLGVPDNDLVGLLLADSDAIPQTFIFDRKGQLTKRFVGFGETTGEEMNQAVETAIQSSAD